MRKTMITVVIDGMARRIPGGSTVAGVLEAQGEDAGHVLVEVNGAYVHPEDHGRRVLVEGDRLEIIYPAFGG